MTPVGYGGLLTSTAASNMNSLIVAPEAPGWMDGVGPFEDGYNLANGLMSGDWVGVTLSGASVVATGVDAVLNPISWLISLGVGWMLEHLWPLKDWLDQLTGDHRMVSSYAQTWGNVSTAVNGAANELNASIGDLQGLQGFAMDVYRKFLATMASTLHTASAAAQGVGVAVELLSTIVKAVHDMVRDVISDVVGFIAQSLILGAATLGTAAPVIAGQAATKTAKWAAMLAEFIKDLITSAATYTDLAKTLKEIYDRVTETLDGKLGTA
ncbi:hypothetical protein [Microbacterium binotii]|uniref:hypothetical protein n=1 Tax=Microbacterium binotii TaxID=462710 RepID=UPI001F2E5A15|nr:hypothetical protein [Microbacterium binotii]UIN30738.1 hypothetical protein LXM64_00600 [Microbacterium binotii]